MYASLPGRTPGSLTGTAGVFLKELRSEIPDKPIEVFAPYAGEAAEVLVNAIRIGHDRAGTIAQLFKTHVSDGIVGSFSITPTGDPRPAPISVLKAGSTFALAKTVTPPTNLIDAARGH